MLNNKKNLDTYSRMRRIKLIVVKADCSRNQSCFLMPSNRWDEGNENNWTMQKFIDEQPKLGTHVPANIGKVVIKNYLENRTSPKNAGTRINNVLEDNATIANTISTNVESNLEDNNIPLKTESERQVTTRTSEISWGSGLSTNMAAANNDMMYSMLNTMQSMHQTCWVCKIQS